ncbi:MAG: sulfite reductase, partial [Gammaproteobacteria bacterium]
EQVLAVAEHVVGVQRDFGDRTNRKHARLKYTLDDRGVDWFRGELERRLGFALAPAVPVTFTHRGDRHGWREGDDGRWHLTLFIENGRLRDSDDRAPLSALREIARVHDGEFRCTPNQNVTIANVAPAARAVIDAILGRHGLSDGTGVSAVRTNAMACVALPTCGLAMAESERYLPALITKIEALLDKHGLGGEALAIRMTGCPNGCARPYNAEVALVGKAPGYYAVHLGGDVAGERLNVLVEENADEAAILALLDGHFAAWAAGRAAGEPFGDFLVRSGRLAAAAGGAA